MRVLLIIIGYLCAIVGALVIHLAIGAVFPDTTNSGTLAFDFNEFVGDVIIMAIIGVPITIIATIFQFAIAIHSAEKYTIRSVSYYLLTGIATGISGMAVILFFISLMPRFDAPLFHSVMFIVGYGFLNGSVAGLIYWLIAGRKAGTAPEAPQTTH